MIREVAIVSIEPDSQVGDELYSVTFDLPLSTIPFFTALRDNLNICGHYAASRVDGISYGVFDCFDGDSDAEFSSRIFFEVGTAICSAERHFTGVRLKMTIWKQTEGLDRLDHTLSPSGLPENFWIEPASIVRKILSFTKH